MRRIEKTFSSLKQKDERGLITFITAGDPDIDTTERLVLELEEKGADIVELGVPFTDPLADGPVIQKASLRSLHNGISLKKIVEMVERLRKKTEIPIVLMSSYNPVFCYNEESFISDAVSAGVDGIIIPDVPPEEGKELRAIAEKQVLDMIYLVAPTSSPERVQSICNVSSGFVYYVSLTGVTGAREKLASNIKEKLSNIKRCTSLPVAVGFGISRPEHVAAVGEVADGVIVGSALVRIMEDTKNNKEEMVTKVGLLTSDLKEACR